MSAKIMPRLWFDTQAEEAARYYVSVFENSSIDRVTHYPDGVTSDAPPGEGYPEERAGQVLTVEFTVDGQPLMALNGGPDFPFTEAISLSVECRDQAEVDRYWDRLVGDGGQESVCGWCKDKYGLSWQISPAVLNRSLDAPDPAARTRVTQAMLSMKKIDVAAIEAALRG